MNKEKLQKSYQAGTKMAVWGFAKLVAASVLTVFLLYLGIYLYFLSSYVATGVILIAGGVIGVGVSVFFFCKNIMDIRKYNESVDESER